jgi:hypothetical protein
MFPLLVALVIVVPASLGIIKTLLWRASRDTNYVKRERCKRLGKYISLYMYFSYMALGYAIVFTYLYAKANPMASTSLEIYFPLSVLASGAVDAKTFEPLSATSIDFYVLSSFAVLLGNFIRLGIVVLSVAAAFDGLVPLAAVIFENPEGRGFDPHPDVSNPPATRDTRLRLLPKDHDR